MIEYIKKCVFILQLLFSLLSFKNQNKIYMYDIKPS